MIYLEVIKSSAREAIGLYEFEFDRISIGRSKKNDLIFLDKELPLHYLDLKFLNGQLVVQSLVQNPFFFVNGKKISGTLKIKEQDVIAFGENQIRIINFQATQIEDDFSNEFEKFNKEAPELKCALDYIESVILKLEDNKNV